MTAACDQPRGRRLPAGVSIASGRDGEKRSQRIEGVKAPESAASRRVGVATKRRPLPCWSRRVLSNVPAFAQAESRGSSRGGRATVGTPAPTKYRFGAVSRTAFSHDMSNVHFYGIFREVEPDGNQLVGKAE